MEEDILLIIAETPRRDIRILSLTEVWFSSDALRSQGYPVTSERWLKQHIRKGYNTGKHPYEMLFEQRLPLMNTQIPYNRRIRNTSLPGGFLPVSEMVWRFATMVFDCRFLID